MDEDELAVLQKNSVGTKADYDTFGDTAAEMAQTAAAADAQARPSAIPGAVFQDLIAPVPDSVGTHTAHEWCIDVCKRVQQIITLQHCATPYKALPCEKQSFGVHFM